MIGIIVFVMVVIGLFLQLRLGSISLSKLHYVGRYDLKLAEPDEKIVYTATLLNDSWIPMMFVNLHENYPAQVTIHMDDEWKKIHLQKSVTYQNTNHRMFILPKHLFKSKIMISLPKRGIYDLGRYYLEMGDYLGLKTKLVSHETPTRIVVMPKRSTSSVAIKTLGGFLGDVSVRRFIMEDPVLTVGYREYTGREPFKNISWSQTAKTGELQVKQFDYTVDINVAVVLNLEGGSANDIEECFELTRLACEELEGRHIPYAFYSNSDVMNVSEGLGTVHLNRILRGMGNSSGYTLTEASVFVEELINEKRDDRSYIVITPNMTSDVRAAFNNLQNHTANEICYLYGVGGAETW